MMRTRKSTASISSSSENSSTMPVRTGICTRTPPRLPLIFSSASFLNSKSKVGAGSSWLVVVAALVIVSFWYGIRKMHHRHDPFTHHDVPAGVLPSITIFSAPRSFSASSGGLGTVGARQDLAVRSWLALSPNVSIVLFGHHPSIFSFAETLGPRVSVESAIDFTFLGTPFFHSMFSRSQASNSEISVLVDHETVLLPDFITTLILARKLDLDWLIISMSSNQSHFPFHLDKTGNHWLQDGKQINFEKLQEFLVQKRHLSACGDRVLMAWNRGNLPLHSGVLPPFLYGKGFHNQWLINEALSSNFRLVIDASDTISSFYPEIMDIQSNQFLTSSDSGDVCEKKWEDKGNAHLAALYGSLHFKQNKFSSILIRLVKCAGNYVFINTADSTVYSLHCADGHSCVSLNQLVSREQEISGLLKGKLLPYTRDRWIKCLKDKNSFYRSDKCSIMESSMVSVTLPTQLYLPFSLELLLQIIADGDKSVVLAVAGDNYRDMLMSWICRLRHLSVTNFIVCALDIEIYQFSVLQGLPVFKDPLAPSNISVDDCHFGSECFQRVTKVKSRLVLQIMKLGYNVLLSDVDVYWFHNPLPFLHSFGPAVLVAQSDEYNETGPINLPRRLNSGFYFAHSDMSTISAMEKVVKHASASGLSEQPSFYDVLCGEGGINRLGDNKCFDPETNLTVHFLDRDLFPNGAFQGLWEKADVKSTCQKKGCLILHNNWISGRKRKLERQVLSDLWAYDASSGMCLQDWHSSRSTSYI